MAWSLRRFHATAVDADTGEATASVWRPFRGGVSTATALVLALVFSGLAGAREGQDDQFCLDCHGKEELTKTLVGGRTLSLYTDEDILKASAHRDVPCLACHADYEEIPHPTSPRKVNCGGCHTNEREEYLESIHGVHVTRGLPGAPQCATCHGTHEVQGVESLTSEANPLNLTRVCVGCHEDPELKAKYDLPEAEFIKAFERSVHGRALRRGGLVVAAVCNDCHGTHTILPADDPRSAVYRKNIPEDCGKCHRGITSVYSDSVHGRAVAQDNLDAPVCTDCHGEHTIMEQVDPLSTVAPRNVPKTCSTCHENLKLAARYGLPRNRLATYLDSFHGVANKFGETVVANCGSCHGVHDVRPSSDPRSTIHKNNVPTTCGKCHPKAGKHFAEGSVHVEATKESLYGKWLVNRFYTVFISILVIMFVGYVSLDLLNHRRRKRSSERRSGGHGR